MRQQPKPSARLAVHRTAESVAPPKINRSFSRFRRYCFSGARDEELVVRLFVGFNRAHGGYVLDELAAAFRAFVFDCAYPAGGDVAGLEAEDSAVTDLDVGAKPIGAEHASGAIESHRRGDRTFEIFSGAGQNSTAHGLRPGHAADQRVIQAATFKGHSMREFAQLQQLQQDGTLRKLVTMMLASVVETRSSLR